MIKTRISGIATALALCSVLSFGAALPASAVEVGADGLRRPSNLWEIIHGLPAAPAPTAKTGVAAAAGRAASTDLRGRIAAHARAAGVPAELAEAVVSYESRFNPRARGSAGEIGLMQIKPQTARALGYRGSAAGLFDVDTNLRWGMAYLAGAYRLAGGDTCGTILRYNAGHGARRMTEHATGYCTAVRQYVAAL